MWGRLLYLVCIVEAGVLAAILAALVVDPSLAGSPLTPRMRQLCAVVALVLMIGCAYAAVRWLWDAMVSLLAWFQARRESDVDGSELEAADLAERAPRAVRGERAA